MEITLVFPHQLYKSHPALEKGRVVYLVEDPLYFRQYPFHKKKLVLHRASMKSYSNQLKAMGITVEYIDATNPLAATEALFKQFADHGVERVMYCDTTDYLLERRIERYAGRNAITLHRLESPNFLTSRQEIHAYFGNGRRFFMADFYKYQRKRLGILVNNNEPVGGRWSFDEDNRKKIPKGTPLPEFHHYGNAGLVTDAIRYVESEFKDNYGSVDDFLFPTDHAAAEQLFDDFLKERFREFGVYQDAILHQQHFLFHSVISSSLNIGLLDPTHIVTRTLDFAGTNKIPLNSVEGFLRQVIGWREYIRAVYLLKGVEERRKNHFGFTATLPESFWTGTTGIDPVDSVIRRLEMSAYSHHIERLMVVGNFMLLCEFNPDEVYRWFMTWYIDAYDWVMVPNVYGMSQFADGGMMSTKPYISGSNYLLKMSDFKKGEWSATWDGLFWRFMTTHLDVFQSNPRLSFLLNTWTKMPESKRSEHLRHAESYLAALANPRPLNRLF